ncbi:MAG: hypothetical protein RPS47_04505 [Colwellia sp.]|jgi:hypothetical protein
MDKSLEQINLAIASLVNHNESYSWVPGGTWSAGGCGVLSMALLDIIHDVYHPRPVVIQGKSHHNSEVAPQHVCIQIKVDVEELFIDADGIQTKDRLLTKMVTLERLISPSIAFYDNDACVQQGITATPEQIEKTGLYLRNECLNIQRNSHDRQ